MELISKTTDLYDPQYCSKENEYCSLKSSYIIGEFVQTRKPFEFSYGFISHCTSINERFSKLEGFLHSRPRNKVKTFPLFGNEFLPPSRNNSLTAFRIMYPLKQRDICDHTPICIMSSGFIFDDIIMNIIMKKKLARHNEENDCLFTQIENNIIYTYRGSLQYFY